MGNSNTISLRNTSSVVRYRNEKPVHYTLKIQSFSVLMAALATSNPNRYESQIFKAGGFKWKLALYPNGDVINTSTLNAHYDRHISLYLVSAEDDISSNGLEINVMITFLVYNKLQDKYLGIQDGKVKCFHAMKTEWGFNKLISVSSFCEASNGFLVNDSCAFGVDIFVMDYNNKNNDDRNKGEVFSLIKQPTHEYHYWKFTNFSLLNKDRYESQPFTVEGYNWKILLYPRGFCCKKRDGCLSLYLYLQNFRELPQNFQVYVEYEMSVVSQLRQGTQRKTNRCRYDLKTWCSGFSEFMSVNDLMNPTKHFLYNDTLFVGVKINNISALETLL